MPSTPPQSHEHELLGDINGNEGVLTNAQRGLSVASRLRKLRRAMWANTAWRDFRLGYYAALDDIDRTGLKPKSQGARRRSADRAMQRYVDSEGHQTEAAVGDDEAQEFEKVPCPTCGGRGLPLSDVRAKPSRSLDSKEEEDE